MNININGKANFICLDKLIIKLYVPFPNAWNVEDITKLIPAKINPNDKILKATIAISKTSLEISNIEAICPGNIKNINWLEVKALFLNYTK